MMETSLTLTAIAAMVLSAGPGAKNPNPWEEVADENDVKVWTRDVPNSSILEIKAVTITRATPERIWAVLQDVAAYPQFMPYVQDTRIISTFAGGHYEYQFIDPPIVDERDYTLRIDYQVNANSGVRTRTWRAQNDKGPKKREDAVRVEVNRGSWTLEPLPKGRTRVTYYLFTDPGGSIPNWIANMANTTSVPELLAAVSNRSVNPAWTRD